MTQHDDVDYKEVLAFTLNDIVKEVDAYLESNRAKIEQAYQTGYPTENAISQKLIEQPKEVGDLIDVALAIRFYLNDTHALLYRMEERRTTMPLELLMYNIGLLWGYFAEHTGIVALPVDLEERYRRQRAAEDGLKPSKRREAELDKLLAPHLKKVRREYEKGEREPHHTYTRMYLNVYSKLIDEIVETGNPRTINSKKREAWTKKDLEDYAVRILREKISPIAREFGCRFGDKGVTIPKDD